jgi:hypothetical protein
MATATLQSRFHHNRTHRTLKTQRSTTLVPKAKVEDMLREIAFVLHATRRISQEIREEKTRPE